MKNEFYDPDFWETKQGDGSANRFTGEAKFPTGTDLKISKDWKKSNKSNTAAKAATGKAVGKALGAAADIIGQFTQNRKVDYSGINRPNKPQETDLTEPGYSDYFARDNKGPV